jgi:hypothetical protein
VKVVQLFKIDDYSSEMRVIDDSNEIWFCQVLNMKYRWLREGQFIRIRSANLEHYSKYERTFGLKPYSNILSLPYPSLSVRKMLINSDEVMKNIDKELLSQDKIMHPVVVTHITSEDHKYTPLKTLEEIVKEDGSNNSNLLHKVRISVEGITQSLEGEDGPSNIVRIHNTKTNQSKEATAKSVLKANERFVFYI